MKLSIHIGDKALDFEGDAVTDQQFKDVLNTFIRILDPEDETVSDAALADLTQATERVEGLDDKS